MHYINSTHFILEGEERERQTFKNTKLKCVVNVFKNALIILRGEKSINNINE